MDGNQEITAENIRDAMTKLGKEISDEELEQVMQIHDSNSDKKLSFDEFKAMMLGQWLFFIIIKLMSYLNKEFQRTNLAVIEATSATYWEKLRARARANA